MRLAAIHKNLFKCDYNQMCLFAIDLLKIKFVAQCTYTKLKVASIWQNKNIVHVYDLLIITSTGSV